MLHAAGSAVHVCRGFCTLRLHVVFYILHVVRCDLSDGKPWSQAESHAAVRCRLRIYVEGCTFHALRCTMHVATRMLARCTLQPKRPEAVGTDPTRNPRPRAGGRSLATAGSRVRRMPFDEAGRRKMQPGRPSRIVAAAVAVEERGAPAGLGIPAGMVVPHPAGHGRSIYLPHRRALE